ncbi:MAG: UvrD-helicase domain-containing protein [Symbiobacterium sp.]|uniref:ATP-dependent helicase n=1 Tax=Symbiobacterium sp. TaxID=1971213 RepID=UPI0034648A49
MLDAESIREYRRLREAVRSALLADLNEQQRAAVLHGEGPLLILAGAGSGKTRVIAYRIAHLILFGPEYDPDVLPPEDMTEADLAALRTAVEARGHRGIASFAHLLAGGVDPWRILAITFTNKAAAEMRERVEQMVGDRAREVWAATFHSACVRMLRRDIERLGYGRNFVILDAEDQQAVIKDCLKRLSLSDRQFQPGAVLGTISAAKNQMLDPQQFAARAGDYWRAQVAKVYALYQERLKSNNALDFDDLLLKTVELLERFDDVRTFYQRKFQFILVDEYQDTNHVQNRLIFLLAGQRQNLAVVGDDDQGIYSWRGADISNILEFEKQFPACRVIKLEQNYRSTQNILTAAYEVVRHNVGRKEKRLWTAAGAGDPVFHYTAADERDEAAFVAREVERLVAEGLPDGTRLTYQDFAVLYRTHAQSRALEEAMVLRSIPYGIYGGLRFFERKEIKDVLAYLRLIANPADTISFRRAVSVPKRGIGPATVDKLVDYAEQWQVPVATAALDCSMVPGLSGTYRRRMEEFGALIEELTNLSAHVTVGELIAAVLEKTGYLDELQADPSLEAAARVENVKELRSMAAEFEPPEGEELDGLRELDAFLSTVALLTDADQVGEGQNKVTLMTLHSAKGLEFPVVFLVGMEEGVFPHSRSLTDEVQMEEERRLCYVGMTRARYRLYLTHAVSRNLWGQENYNNPSRFLDEIPEELIQEVAAPGVAAAGTPSPGGYAGRPGPGSWTPGGRGTDGPNGGYGSGTGYGRAGGYGPGAGSGGYGASRGYGRGRTYGMEGDESSGGRCGWGGVQRGYGRRGGEVPDDDDFSPPIGSAGWGRTQQARRLQEATAPSQVETPVFHPGDRVWHDRFGEGVVKAVIGDTVTVQFAAAGQRVLVASYLRPAGGDEA